MKETLGTITLRDGNKVLAKFNKKRNVLESVLYSNSSQAHKRVALLRASGVNADVKRYPLSRVFYVVIR